MNIGTEFIQNFNKQGIYRIINHSNGKVYIGSTKNFKKRYIQHLSKLTLQKASNKYLLNAYNQCKESFEMQIVEIVEDVSLLRIRESYYIQLFKSWDKNFGYNLTTDTICAPKDRAVSIKISNSLKNYYKLNKNTLKSSKTQFKKGQIPWNKGRKLLNTDNYHKTKTVTTKVIEGRIANAVRSRERGDVVVCLNELGEELFVFRSVQDLIDITNNDSSYKFKVSRTRLTKAIKNKTVYKGMYFIKRVPYVSDYIRKSDEFIEKLRCQQ